MTHPTREEWMAFLYDEVPQETKSLLHAHIDVCVECRRQVETWRSASQRLDAWKLPRRSKRRSFAPLIRFAAAAAVIALAVVSSARVWSLNNDVTRLRADLQREVANRNTSIAQASDDAAKSAVAQTQMILAEFAKAVEEKRGDEQRLLLTALQQVQAKAAQDYAGLRKELETVAVLTEAGLRQAHTEIANITYPTETN